MTDAWIEYRRAQGREQARRWRENNRERWLVGCREATRRYRERKLWREWQEAARAYLDWLDKK